VAPTTREIVMAVIEAERCGRLIAAGLGLCKLRERYETWWREDLPADERTWRTFTIKHFPFGPDRADHLIGRMVHYGGLVRCTRCATEAACSCACGAPYAPVHRWAAPVRPAPQVSALDRAIAALAATPERSNRAIAAEIGVSFETVRRARRKMQETAGHVSPNVSPADAKAV
jgi:hypothetical protein